MLRARIYGTLMHITCVIYLYINASRNFVILAIFAVNLRSMSLLSFIIFFITLIIKTLTEKNLRCTIMIYSLMNRRFLCIDAGLDEDEEDLVLGGFVDDALDSLDVEAVSHDMSICTNPYNAGGGLWFACGKCNACRRRRVNELVMRLQHEAHDWLYMYFITLTYDDDHLPSNKSINKRDLQLYNKRLLKHMHSKRKHVSIGEYGGKFGRPHYHQILLSNLELNEITWCVEKSWTFGFTKVCRANEAAIRYTCKYVFKQLDGDLSYRYYGDKLAPFALRSTGIGKAYCLRHADEFRAGNGKIRHKGRELLLPRYYRKLLGIEEVADDVLKHVGQTIDKAVYKYAVSHGYCKAHNFDNLDDVSRYVAMLNEREFGWRSRMYDMYTAEQQQAAANRYRSRNNDID